MSISSAIGTVGQAVERVDDHALSTGAAEFLRDRHPDGVRWLAFARSTEAHALVHGVDLSAARALPGVLDAIAGADLAPDTDMVPPLVRDGQAMRTTRRPLLARERVRFYGEPIAAVLAETQYAAWDGAAAVAASLEPLPVVTDPLAAALPDSPRLFAPDSNVLLDEGEGWKNAEALLGRCTHVVSRQFTVGRYAPAPLETRGAVVEPTGHGVTVWCSTQAPAQLKRAILDSLDLDEDAVRVIAPRVGGGFGQKAHAYPEEVLAVLCCLRSGRTVKWLESRQENIQASCQARDQVVECRAGCDADGRLEVLLCDLVSDVGAYGVWPHGHLLEALGTPVAMPGAYALSAFAYRTRAIVTNKCPGGAYRGVGFAVATFVRERMVEILSRELGADPVELRARSAGPPGPRMTATGLELRGDFPRAIREVAAELEQHAVEMPAEPGIRVGTGYALYVEPVSPGSLVFAGRGMSGIVGYDDARVRLDTDGQVVVVTSSPAIGQGTETTFAQVVAQALGCARELVRVDPSDTDRGLDGTGTFASRSAASVAVACQEAACALRERLLALAARRLGGQPDELAIEGASVRGADAEISFGELAREVPEGLLEVTRRTDPGVGGVAYGAHACTVRVDVRTGRVDVLAYAVFEDCGEMINPGIVRNQTLGGVAQAVGMCLTERLEYDDDGRPLVGGFADYRVPRVTEAPDCRMRHGKSEATAGLRLGVGEGGAVAAAAALGNAVSDAIGIEVNSMPFDPPEVWRLCRAEGARRSMSLSNNDSVRARATTHGN